MKDVNVVVLWAVAGQCLPGEPSPGESRELERWRTRDVQRCGLMDSGGEERFDRLTREACRRLAMPYSTLTLITDERRYLKSVVGPFERHGPRRSVFCDTTIRTEDGLVIPDTLAHPVFCGNELVTGPPHLRSYAGIPLRGSGGIFVGSFCVMDSQPRAFTERDFADLRRLADQAELELNAAQVPQ